LQRSVAGFCFTQQTKYSIFFRKQAIAAADNQPFTPAILIPVQGPNKFPWARVGASPLRRSEKKEILTPSARWRTSPNTLDLFWSGR